MKYTILILAVVLSACGGSSNLSEGNPFQEALGKTLPAQPNATTPTDPFAPLVKKNGG